MTLRRIFIALTAFGVGLADYQALVICSTDNQGVVAGAFALLLVGLACVTLGFIGFLASPDDRRSRHRPSSPSATIGCDEGMEIHRCARMDTSARKVSLMLIVGIGLLIGAVVSFATARHYEFQSREVRTDEARARYEQRFRHVAPRKFEGYVETAIKNDEDSLRTSAGLLNLLGVVAIFFALYPIVFLLKMLVGLLLIN